MVAPADDVGKFHDLKQHWHAETRTAMEQADMGADMTAAVLTAFSRFWADRTPGTDPDAPSPDR